MHQCLEVIKKTGANTLDLTGGAPEMNPDFRWFVDEASKAGVKDFIVRSNLTIIKANKKYFDLPEFFKNHNVHVMSSMPHWTRGKTDKQRGDGVFDKSIKALQELNAIGYGMPDSNLKLDLVFNPSGAFSREYINGSPSLSVARTLNKTSSPTSTTRLSIGEITGSRFPTTMLLTVILKT